MAIGSAESSRKYRDRQAYNIPIIELAAEFGVLKGSLMTRATRKGIQYQVGYGPDVRGSCVTKTGAKKLRELYQNQKDEKSPGFLSAQEVMKDLALSQKKFIKGKRLRQIRNIRVGTQLFYHPADVRAWGSEVRQGLPSGVPRGGLGAGEMQALFGLKNHQTLSKWRIRHGCPAHKMRNGYFYYRLKEVLVWLEGQKDYRMKVHAEKLRAML